MEKDSQDAFEQFIRQRRADLKRIARHTRGEHQLADVENVTWVMAQDMRSAKGIPINFPDSDYQELLLSYVYQELVRYTETQVRYAIRLDHGRTDDEDEHPLMRTLVSDDGRDPLAELLAREAMRQAQATDTGHSFAAAYACLLRQFDNKTQAAADFLLISASQVRRRCARAIWLARHQFPLSLNHTAGSRFRLKPLHAARNSIRKDRGAIRRSTNVPRRPSARKRRPQRRPNSYSTHARRSAQR